MADDGTVKIRLEILGGEELKKHNKIIAEQIARYKDAELQVKKGAINEKQYLEIVRSADQVLERYENTTTKVINAKSGLWHATNRVNLGFKSLATETKTVEQQLRAMYQEERVMNRTLTEMNQAFGTLGNLLGASGLGKTVTSATNNFQSFNFALDSTQITLNQMAEKFPKHAQAFTSLGAAIGTLSIPLAIVGGAAVSFINDLNALEETVTKLREEVKRAEEESKIAGLSGADLRAELRKQEKVVAGKKWRKYEEWQELLKSPINALLPQEFLGLRLQAIGEAEKEYLELLKEELRIKREIAQLDRKLAESATAKLGAPLPVPEIVLNPETGQPELRKYPKEVLKMESAGLPRAAGNLAAQVRARQHRIYMGVDPVERVKLEVQSMNAGILQLGHTLSTSLALGFQRGFAEGQNMLKTFTDSILASMAAMAAQQAAAAGVAGLLSFLGVGPFGPIFGALGGIIGISSTPGIATGELVGNSAGAGMAVAAEVNALRRDFRKLHIEVNRGELAIAVQEGNMIRNGVTY